MRQPPPALVFDELCGRAKLTEAFNVFPYDFDKIPQIFILAAGVWSDFAG